MIAAILAIVAALISYFGAKKAGASDATAAAVGLAAGAGTYYVATQTDWGKALVSDIDGAWTDLVGRDGDPILDADGKAVTAPEGAVPVYNEDGTLAKDPDGNPLYTIGGKLISTVGDVLKDWGPIGTAAVVGTANGTVESIADKYGVWILVGLGAFLLLR